MTFNRSKRFWYSQERVIQDLGDQQINCTQWALSITHGSDHPHMWKVAGCFGSSSDLKIMKTQVPLKRLWRSAATRERQRIRSRRGRSARGYARTSPSLGTCTNYQFRKFQTARSLLYQSRFLRPNTHFSAFFETYKICKPLHRSKFKICRFFVIFWRIFEIFVKFCIFLLKSSRTDDFSSKFWWIFVGIAGNDR